MEKEKHTDMDLIELTLFLAGKWKSILLAVICCIAIGVIFIVVTLNISQVRIRINTNFDTPSTYVLCGQEDKLCRRAVILSTFTSLIPDKLKNAVTMDKTDHLVAIRFLGSTESIDVTVKQIKHTVSQMQAWYIADSDLKKYTLTDGLTGTETYARLTLLSDAVKHYDNFVILSIEITKKYKISVIILISVLTGSFFSVSYHLFRRALKVA